jgi:hypothetical protein
MLKKLIAALTGLALMLPVAASAQTPSYATQAVSTDQNIHGRVVNFDHAYSLSVRDERGYIDNVQLHPGTIINPTGLTLAPGMVVSVLGYNAGNFFAANEIDTPYTFYSGYPYYAGHPWNYYGPTISLGFFFGSTGWWHGGYFGGGYRFVGGARVYNHVRINEVYRNYGGHFQGRNVVARPERGGYYGRPAGHAFARGGVMHGGHGGGMHGGGIHGGDHGRP